MEMDIIINYIVEDFKRYIKDIVDNDFDFEVKEIIRKCLEIYIEGSNDIGWEGWEVGERNLIKDIIKDEDIKFKIINKIYDEYIGE